MVSERQVERSKAIQQATGKTFHFATRLLPQRVRHPTYVLYAFFRMADEVVDAADAQNVDAETQTEQLASLRDQALGRTDPESPVLAAFQELRAEYDIPDEEVEVFVDAMQSDTGKTRYETYEELREYMRGSAAAVGVMMVSVMRPDDPGRATPHAVALAEAFQLTNFVRDVREDVLDRRRIYLPLDDLRAHGVTEDQVEDLAFDENAAAAVATELRRAEDLYREGIAGVRYLPEDCQFSVLLAAVLYAEHHRAIRDRGYDVFSATPSLSRWRMAWLLAKTRYHWARNRDPEAVFRRVSAVPDRGDAEARRSRDGESPAAE